MDEEMHLEHHGIKGQKWGIRRFQNSDGSLTESGRKHYGIGKPRDTSGSAEKAGKQKLREDIIKDPRKITKYSKAFTREEVNKIIEDINWNRKLYDVRRSEKQRRLDKVKDVSDTIGTFSNLMNNGINAWNNAAAINNALVDSGVFSSGKKMNTVKRKENN